MKTRELKETRNETVEKMEEKIVLLKASVIKAQMPRLGETKTNVKIARAAKREISQLKTLITEKLNTKTK